ncbi:hypothetical protein EBB07_34480 [Paenibacillaceae bacterium]|nr:hypothetical protein EBB07_34480 [Paenibacillaceae bacterium]
MKGYLQVSKIRSGRLVAAALVLCLLLGMLPGSFTPVADAKSVRIASVVSVSGTVEVKKAGGKRYFKAYKNMPLNEGDHLTTGAKSSVILKVQDRGDEATIGEHSSLYVSELRDSNGSKKSKFTIWTGTMWVKASSLVAKDEEFEVETPTAVMGVRGTTMFITVDPSTGDAKFMIGSGVGVVKQKNEEGEHVILPGQMLQLLGNDSAEDMGAYPIDLASLVAQMSPDVIEALIRSKQQIDEENSALIEKLKNPSAEEREQLSVQTEADLDRVQRNLDNMVANLIKEAIKSKIVDQSAIQKVVDEANKTLDKKIDLNQAKPAELTKDELEKQLKQKQLEEARKKQLELERQRNEQQKKQQEALLKKLEEQRRLAEEANRKALEEARLKAHEEYLKKLNEQQQKEYEDAKKELEGTNPPVTTPTPPVYNPGTPPIDPGSQSPLSRPGPGPIEGPITETVSGSGNATFGPASGPPLRVEGGVTIQGSGSGVYTLRNLEVAGEQFLANVPNGSVKLLNSVTVNGQTIIEDVAPGTFESAATHREGIWLRDNNRSRIRLTGEASNAFVRIDSGETITLEGTYSKSVTVSNDAPNAEIILAEGTVFSETGLLEIQGEGVTVHVQPGVKFSGTLYIAADGVELTGHVKAIKNIDYDPSVTLTESVAQRKEKRSNLLSIVNSAEDGEAMFQPLDEEYENVTVEVAWDIFYYRESNFLGEFDNLERLDEFFEKKAAPTGLKRVEGVPIEWDGVAIYDPVYNGLLLEPDSMSSWYNKVYKVVIREAEYVNIPSTESFYFVVRHLGDIGPVLILNREMFAGEADTYSVTIKAAGYRDVNMIIQSRWLMLPV